MYFKDFTKISIRTLQKQINLLLQGSYYRQIYRQIGHPAGNPPHPIVRPV